MNLRIVPLGALALLLGIAAPALGEVPAGARPQAVQERVLSLVNHARAAGRQCGKDRFAAAAPLSASPELQRAARSHARDMARREYFDHQSPDASQPRDRVRRAGYRPRLTGENIAFGPESAEEVVAGWLSSPGHCANIMDPRFRHMGVAVVEGRERGHFYWVQDLGDPVG